MLEKARSMLNGVGLGHEFWVEMVETACYLVNRSLSLALEEKTPHEVWNCKKPSLSNLMVFGCDAYVHVPKDKRTKLDSKSERCMFSGYTDGLKVLPKEPEKIEFELKEEESKSIAEYESKDEEPQTPTVRILVREIRKPERYSPSAFCSFFSLFITDDDPRSVKDAIDSYDGKLWKEALVYEKASLDKNKAY
eukprot:PITA_07858